MLYFAHRETTPSSPGMCLCYPYPWPLSNTEKKAMLELCNISHKHDNCVIHICSNGSSANATLADEFSLNIYLQI